MTDPYKELREGLERLKAADGILRGPEADVAALLAERDALREVARRLVNWCDANPPAGEALYFVQLARAALSQSEPQGQK